MSIDVEHSAAPAASQRQQQQQQDFIRGARAIGQAIGIDKRAAHHLIATGALKSVRKVGADFGQAARDCFEKLAVSHEPRQLSTLREVPAARVRMYVSDYTLP